MTAGGPPLRVAAGEAPAALALVAPAVVARSAGGPVPDLVWVGAVLYAVLLVAPAVGPRRRVRWDQKPLPATRLAVAVVCGVGALVQLRYAEGADGLGALAVAVVLGVLGNAMPALRPNWFFGVRTPWTLRDDAVWDRTHRATGHALVATSALLVGLWAVLDAGRFAVVSVALPLGVVAAAAVYSWWTAR